MHIERNKLQVDTKTYKNACKIPHSLGDVCSRHLPELGGVIDRFGNLAQRRVVVIPCFILGWGGVGGIQWGWRSFAVM